MVDRGPWIKGSHWRDLGGFRVDAEMRSHCVSRSHRGGRLEQEQRIANILACGPAARPSRPFAAARSMHGSSIGESSAVRDQPARRASASSETPC